MKATLSLCLALLTAASVQADIFRPRGVSGVTVNRGAPDRSGGNRGGVDRGGHDRNDFHRPSYAWRPSYYGYRNPGFSYYPGYDWRYYPYANLGYYGGYNGTGYYNSGSGYYGSGYGYYNNPAYYGSTNGAATGLALGALAGGIIGNNSGSFHNSGWRGAAWGAGLGWLLGTVVDANRQYVASQQPALAQPAVNYGYGAPAQAQQPVTIINNYYNAPATPMTAANNLFGR